MKLSAKLTIVLFLIVSLTGCNRAFNKVMKSKDPAYKLEMAHKYYNKGQYEKALPLFEEHLTLNRGVKNSEEVLFLYAYSHYYMKDYTMASFYFRNFLTSYPTSKKAEEAQFMMAKSYKKESPRYNLDQTNTFKALEQFQTFVNRYPNSDRVADANDAIDELRGKLLRKAYENAYLYFKIGEFQAAAVALKALLKDYPDVDDPDRVHFTAVKALKQFADKSATVKQLERYEEAAKECNVHRDKFPNSIYQKDVDDMYRKIIAQIKVLENDEITRKEKRGS